MTQPGDGAFRRTDILGTELEPSYSGALSFCRRKYTRDLGATDIAITGVPFDQATSNRPGARFGPEAVRKASTAFSWGPFWPWRFDPFARLGVVDYGDCLFDWGDKEAFPAVLEAHARDILATGTELVSLGGDHFITYPLLRAHAARHGPLALVHFDAHRDVEPDTTGRIDHGTMFAKALQEGLIDPARSVQIGIRTIFDGERAYGLRIFYADEVHDTPAETLARLVCDIVGAHPAYLTFDIDCLDPGIAPGTGTPIPGGLSYHQAASILRRLKPIRFVGMDLVEVAPAYDQSETTALAAAALVMEYLCLRAWQNGARPDPMPD